MPGTEVETIPRRTTAEDERESGETGGCPNCGSRQFRRDSAREEVFCRNCGTIIEEDRVDTSEEYRAFDADERDKKERAGSAVTYTKADRGINTTIGSSGEISRMSGSKKGQYFRLQKWDRRIDDSKKRSMQNALRVMQPVVDELKLPESVYEEAARLTEKAREKDIIKGKGIEATVAAVTYLVARNQEIPRTLDEVADAADLKKRKLGQAYREIARELDIEIEPPRPENFLPRYLTRIDVSRETASKAREVIDRARKANAFVGRGPKAVVAASIYLASRLEGEEITQTEIAGKVGVTEVTVRKNYRHIAEQTGLDEELGEG